MNTEIQAQFDRVEAALNTLVESITSYNPSQSAALSLVETDDDLTKGLERREFSMHHIVVLVQL